MSVTVKHILPSPEQFVEMRIESGWDVPSLQEAKTAIDLSLCGILLMENENVIGMARVLGDGVLCLFIQDVIVAKSCRGKRYGGLIMQKLIDYLQSNYSPNCTVGLMAAKGKVGFYERCGFQSRPSAKTDAGMTAPLHTLRSPLAIETRTP